ncbi:class IV lanthionine synthetase LanL [Nonomuraea sp. NPDC050451]|uniref:class IV lanthionine synthetase LanL n=1 Tax=Nonomuraea sp. NPDC050451 TaxID=3364364 RepID=UPI00379B6674
MQNEDLVGPLRTLLEEIAAPEQWRLRVESFWCYVEPPGYAWRLQGWKLHVSAIVASAPQVLANATRVLVANRACFKFAKGSTQVAELTSMRYPRAGGGKFITVYPDDDRHFRVLIEELHRVTEGLAGPVVLSDRPYLPGSLVHYRYGGFTGTMTRLDDDGFYVPMLVGPDGSWVDDRRQAWFSPPPWAPSPLPLAPPLKPPREHGGPVLIGGRFHVHEAIRHSHRGGVYRALDEETGQSVILKEARPHVADARTWLCHEADMLERLAPLGLAPRGVALLDYQDHLFLAQEEIPGCSLRQWVEERSRERADRRPPPADTLTLAQRLMDAVAQVHDAGVVLRDLSPGNVVVLPDLTLRFVDLEFAAEPDERAARVATPGYTAPEQADAGTAEVAASQAADLYSLGACLLFLCGGNHPVLPPEDDPARPLGERMDLLVRTAMHGNPSLLRLAPAVLGLTAADPAARWSLGRVRASLGNGGPRPGPIATLAPEEQESLLHDLLDHTVERMTPGGRHLWPPTLYENRTGDPGNVHTGAGGVVAVLDRAVRVLGGEHRRAALAEAARWLDEELQREPRILPGLFFGRSGSAWALYEAARTLGDDQMAGRALSYAKRVPLRWPVPDYTHGTAGAGVAQLALWRATGQEEFRARAAFCAEALAESCDLRGGEPLWPIPERAGAGLGSVTHYGFAHGVAGIATFLLAAGEALAEPRYTEIAVACGEMLCSRAQPLGDTVRWPVGPTSDGPEGQVTAWWCNGSGGIGAFLIRLWRVTGEAPFRDAAERAATAVLNERWLVSHIHCHGNAGNGELLIDLAALLGDERHLTRAAEIAACVYGGHVREGGRKIIPPQVTPGLSYSYNMGLAGIIGFLLRLRYGGRRWFMPDVFSLDVPANPVKEGR